MDVKTSSPAVREDDELYVCNNKVVRRISVVKRQEFTGWRNLIRSFTI
jgi:hypothetical protein